MLLLKRILGLFSSDLSIDLGTANTLSICVSMVLCSTNPQWWLFVSNTGEKVEAVGVDAKRMLGRTPGNITAIRPLKMALLLISGH